MLNKSRGVTCCSRINACTCERFPVPLTTFVVSVDVESVATIRGQTRKQADELKFSDWHRTRGAPRPVSMFKSAGVFVSMYVPSIESLSRGAAWYWMPTAARYRARSLSRLEYFM